MRYASWITSLEFEKSPWAGLGFEMKLVRIWILNEGGADRWKPRKSEERKGEETERSDVEAARRARGGEADVKVTFNTSEKRRHAARLDDCDPSDPMPSPEFGSLGPVESHRAPTQDATDHRLITCSCGCGPPIQDVRNLIAHAWSIHIRAQNDVFRDAESSLKNAFTSRNGLVRSARSNRLLNFEVKGKVRQTFGQPGMEKVLNHGRVHSRAKRESWQNCVFLQKCISIFSKIAVKIK